MKIVILGAAGFLGTNLIKFLKEDVLNTVTAVDISMEYFSSLNRLKIDNVDYFETDYRNPKLLDNILRDKEVVYHLVSTTNPTNSNSHISKDIIENVDITSNILDACVRQKIKKVIFISSGGTVYGKESKCPLSEKLPTNPISSYGVQKVAIEKLLFLYNYIYNLDYRVVRLANPYGPYQRPNGVLGAVTTFTYKALNNEEISVYGDGSVVRDFIYVDDAIRGIINISHTDCENKIFNLGCGFGVSVNEVLETIENTLNCKLNISYKPGRNVDVPVNYLDISRYEKYCGKLNPLSLKEGVQKTAEFLKSNFNL